ncbi:MAG: hypothetical protein ACPHO7_07180, partial [Candidatus Puniceispirillaceae bacterium]
SVAAEKVEAAKSAHAAAVAAAVEELKMEADGAAPADLADAFSIPPAYPHRRACASAKMPQAVD